MTKQLRKIQRLLALANDANDEESLTALTKAQQLMMDYKITEDEVLDFNQHVTHDVVVTHIVYSGRPQKWLYRLARIIAKNFRVKEYYESSNPIKLIFTGLESDVQVSEIAFQYARASVSYNARQFMQQPEVKRKYRRKWGLKQDYIEGYLVGLSTALKQSVITNGYELALQLQEAVENELKKLDLTIGKDVTHVVKEHEAYSKGKQEGLKFKDNPQIETV